VPEHEFKMPFHELLSHTLLDLSIRLIRKNRHGHGLSFEFIEQLWDFRIKPGLDDEVFVIVLQEVDQHIIDPLTALFFIGQSL
jgi:hypothetical protein